MHDLLIQYILLVIMILALVMLANKFRIAYPIVLVLGGLALSLTGFFSTITIDPEMVFFIFLPPLLYEAAWQVSWKEFWKFRRVIISFAFPIVIITSCVIAFVSHWMIPGFTLALGFLLGGIISPPDAISASTIMRQVNAPKTLINLTEGESLLNDASSLIVFRFALAAIITGQFHFRDAALDFVLVIVIGTLIGVAIGYIFYYIHRLLPTTTSIEIVLSLVAPYCMYYAAEQFHFSGVLAVVSGGLLLSNKRQSMLTYRSRVQGLNVWSVLGFVLNGIVFMLIGLQLPSITDQLGDIGLGTAIGYGLGISLALIIVRIICTLGASAFTMFIGRWFTVADRNPGWRLPFIFGWAGMRGVVSLAAALSIPLLVNENDPFPYRALILFITFIVILVTLVIQGLTLPWMIRQLKIIDHSKKLPEQQQERIVQKKMAHVSLQLLEEKYGDRRKNNEHIENLYRRLETDMKFYQELIEQPDNGKESRLTDFQTIYLHILDRQRQLLMDINHKEEFDEEIVRKYLTLIDLEEFKVREKLTQGLSNEI